MKYFILLFLIINLCISLKAQPSGSDVSKKDSLIKETQIDRISLDNRLLKLSYAGDNGFLTSLKRPDFLTNLSVGGYLRFLTYYRSIPQPYYNGVEGRHIFVGDEGYGEPLVLINLGGRPTKNTSFSTDLHFTNFFTGSGHYGVLTPHFTVGFSGSINTGFGNFTVRMGGLNWYEISEMTLGSISKVDRYSIFERTPWEPLGESSEKYEMYYDKGTINKDARWGKREFQGIIVESNSLPLGLYAKILYGKTSQNGGYLSNIPNNAYGGQLGKKISTDEFISYNTFTKEMLSDSVNGKSVGYSIHTIAYNKIIGKIIFKGEVGVGSYHSPQYPKKWSEGLKLRFLIPKEVIPVSMDVQYYRIGKYFVNENAGFSNTTIKETGLAHSTSGTQAGQVSNNPFTSPMTDMEDLTNNRTGGHLMLDKSFKKLKIRFGLGISQELENIYNKISYVHRINSLIMNRVVTGWDWWKGNVFGPYDRTYGQFRGIYEIVNINDTIKLKHFNNIELQLKYKHQLFGKTLFVFYNGSYKSCQNQLAIIPKFNDDAWIRIGYHELEMYYQLFNNVMFTGYFGYETIKGNSKTDIDKQSLLDSVVVKPADKLAYTESLKPRNQIGIGVGAGLDIIIAKNMGLYIRERWFKYTDKNFALDKFRGFETCIELKLFF